MAYSTALRRYTAKRIEEIRDADILIGIPCYNNEKTIAHVIQMVTHGLDRHYRDLRSVILIADGGSTDDTGKRQRIPDQALAGKGRLDLPGAGRKGDGATVRLRGGRALQVRACAVVDADLRSITSDWIQYLLDPCSAAASSSWPPST